MDIIAQFLKENGCKEWDPSTPNRIYLDWHAKDLLKINTTWYLTGPLSGFLKDFWWCEGHEPIFRGKRILAALKNAYYDTEKKEFVTGDDKVTKALTDVYTKAAQNWKNTQ